MKKIITKSSQETVKCGQNLAKKLRGGEVIGLIGELGSGKTTFVQGLAKGLGIKDRILSPTFTLMRSYQGGKLNLCHVDLYRLDKPAEFRNLGLEEIWLKHENVVVIEWAEKAGEYLPETTTFIHFKYKNETLREISLKR